MKGKPMKRWLVAFTILTWFGAAATAQAVKVSVLVDLDPNSAAQTVIVESIAADKNGMIYACGRVSGSVWRIDPKDPKLVVAGKVQERELEGKKVRAVQRLIGNNRDTNYGSPERFHFLPGAWNIPDLIVDFQNLELLRFNQVDELQCIGTVASPFAEVLGGRFLRYLGRLGQLDLDIEGVIKRLAKKQ